MRTLKRLFTVLATLAILGGILGGGGYYGWKYYQKGKAGETKIRFTTSQKGDLKVILRETATLQPRKTVEIKSKVAGRILALHVEAGDIVQSGSVIAELDREQYHRNLEQRSRDLELARQTLKGLMPFGEVVTNPEKIDPKSIDTGPGKNLIVDRTLIEYGAAKVDYENKLEMYERNLISLKTLDDARKQFDRSFVAYHDQIRSASLALPKALDDYEQAVEDLQETTIRSPVSGVVTKLPVDEGELVQGAAGMTQGTTLAEVADLDDMQAVVKLNEVDIGKIKIGDPVTLTLDSAEGKEFQGSVETISPSGVATNNVVVFEVKIQLKDKTRIFRPEMTANADILVGQVTDVVKIPLEAIEEKDGVKTVTLLTAKAGAELSPSPTPFQTGGRGRRFAKIEADFYSTSFGPKESYEEKKQTVKTGLSNELWAEVVEGIHEEVILKLPDITLPERRERGFF
ncbi:MAG: Multidrug resistance protein MdtA [bacterium]|nr:Multidrug resistance protein MdtA [bacterium]